jgi:uncharacterized ParB-like nuclease family protein
MKMTDIREIRLGNIHIDDSLQLRVDGTNPEFVQRYAELMKNGTELDPVDVVEVGLDWNVDADYVLAGGFHRYEAALQVGNETIQATIHDGGRAKAREIARKANVKTGNPLSKADMKSIVIDAALDPANESRTGRDLHREYSFLSQPTVAAIVQVRDMVQQTDPPLTDAEIIAAGSYNGVNQWTIDRVRDRSGIPEPLERRWRVGTLVQIADDHAYFDWRGWITGHMPNGGGVHVLAYQIGKQYQQLSDRSAGYEKLLPLTSAASYERLWIEKLRRDNEADHVLFKWAGHFIQMDGWKTLQQKAVEQGVEEMDVTETGRRRYEAGLQAEPAVNQQ